jgi:hypothetical protein
LRQSGTTSSEAIPLAGDHALPPRLAPLCDELRRPDDDLRRPDDELRALGERKNRVSGRKTEGAVQRKLPVVHRTRPG